MTDTKFKNAETRYVNVNVNDIIVSGLKTSVKIEKTLKTEPNNLDLVIYNLSQETRSKLQELAPKNQTEVGIPVSIEVGYINESQNEFTKNTYNFNTQNTSINKDTDTLWFGDLRTVISYFEPPNWITRLTSGDGEKANQISKINQTFGPNTPIDVVIRAIVKKLNESLNNNTPISVQKTNQIINAVQLQGGGKLLSSSTVLSGNTMQVLRDWAKSTDLEFSIQDGQLQILNKRKALADTALEIVTSFGAEGSNKTETGVISAIDVDQEGNVKFKHIIKPGFRCGRLIDLHSQRAEGLYKIEKLTYNFDTFTANEWSIDVEASRFG